MDGGALSSRPCKLPVRSSALSAQQQQMSQGEREHGKHPLLTLCVRQSDEIRMNTTYKSMRAQRGASTS